MQSICCHCNKQIKHCSDQLWHEIGKKVFPQYCETTYDADGGILPSQLHEPKMALTLLFWKDHDSILIGMYDNEEAMKSAINIRRGTFFKVPASKVANLVELSLKPHVRLRDVVYNEK